MNRDEINSIGNEIHKLKLIKKDNKRPIKERIAAGLRIIKLSGKLAMILNPQSK